MAFRCYKLHRSLVWFPSLERKAENWCLVNLDCWKGRKMVLLIKLVLLLLTRGTRRSGVSKAVMGRYKMRGSNSQEMPAKALGPGKRVGSHPFSAGLKGSRKNYWCCTGGLLGKLWSLYTCQLFQLWDNLCKISVREKNLGFFCVLIQETSRQVEGVQRGLQVT